MGASLLKIAMIGSAQADYIRNDGS